MNALPASAQPAPWFAPLDPTLGPSDPPIPAPPWSEFRPASPAAAAWELWSATGAGLVLLLTISAPMGEHAEYFWAYALTALAALRFSPPAIIATEPMILEERMLGALPGLAFGWFCYARPSWGGKDLAVLALSAATLCFAWLNFHRTRLSLPRQF